MCVSHSLVDMYPATFTATARFISFNLMLYCKTDMRDCTENTRDNQFNAIARNVSIVPGDTKKRFNEANVTITMRYLFQRHVTYVALYRTVEIVGM